MCLRWYFFSGHIFAASAEIDRTLFFKLNGLGKHGEQIHQLETELRSVLAYYIEFVYSEQD